MVKLNAIYTRTGDEGETGLVGGARVKKYDLRVDAYGTVDEANATIGLARMHVLPAHDGMLNRIQHDLFDLGADLATPGHSMKDLRITPAHVTRLEHEIDALNEDLSPLTSFVLPGGTPASAALHLARTVTRRAERIVCALADLEDVNIVAIQYINRLSDFLFVLARSENRNGARDVLWQPGANREKDGA